MRHTPFAPILAVALSLSALPLVTRAAEPGQAPQAMKRQITVETRYLLFLPEAYGKDAQKKWPLILFLHGSGERGTDLELVKRHGPPKIVGARRDFPFVVVSPQCEPGTWWDALALAALLDEVSEKYAVDADRVYLTGLSMGGFGTWDLAMRYPDRFAAIAPICGGASTPRRAAALKEMPVWVFHGDQDPAVPVQQSEVLVAALKKAGNTKVQFTVYPGVGHDSWTATYDNPKLYDWFLSHKRSDRPSRR